MDKLKQVTKENFDKFLSEYPNELTSGVTTICEPAFRSFRDELLPTKGKPGSIDYYFDKEVARLKYAWLSDYGEIDNGNTGKFYKYYILPNNTEK